MSYILLLVFSVTNYVPKSFSVSEFRTKEACEVALAEAKKFWRTVDDDSKCISVEAELKKEALKRELKKEEEK